MVSSVRRGAIMVGSLVVALAVAGPLAAAGSTTAPDRETERRWRAACTHDAFDYCTFLALSGNRPAVRNCLERNIDRISESCRKVIRSSQGQAGASSAAPPAPPSD